MNINKLDMRAGTLHGAGILNGNVISTGYVRPGNSPGVLTINGDFTLEPGGRLVIEIGGHDPGQYDQLIVNGNATFYDESKIDIQFVDGFAPEQGDEFSIIDVSGSMMFGDVAFQIFGLAAGFTYNLIIDAGSVKLLATTTGVSTVPLPASFWLLLSTDIVILITGRKKQSAIH